MKATQRYELVRPILYGGKTVKEIHQETGIPLSTLYYYLRRFREGDGQLDSLADKSRAPKNHPHWFTEEQKDNVVLYKRQNPEKSTRQIAQNLSESGILQISFRSVANILAQRRLTENFF